MNAERSTTPEQPSWLELVWMEVMDEIAYETEHPQEWQGTSMYPVEAPNE